MNRLEAFRDRLILSGAYHVECEEDECVCNDYTTFCDYCDWEKGEEMENQAKEDAVLFKLEESRMNILENNKRYIWDKLEEIHRLATDVNGDDFELYYDQACELIKDVQDLVMQLDNEYELDVR